MLNNLGYRHTLRMCNTYCFSTATMVTLTRLSVTLYKILPLLLMLLSSELRVHALDTITSKNNLKKSLITLTAVILIIKAKKMHCFWTLFGKELYMFRTDLLSIIRSLNTVFTATGICHTGYVVCLQARSGWNTVLRLLMMDGKSVRNM